KDAVWVCKSMKSTDCDPFHRTNSQKMKSTHCTWWNRRALPIECNTISDTGAQFEGNHPRGRYIIFLQAVEPAPPDRLNSAGRVLVLHPQPVLPAVQRGRNRQLGVGNAQRRRLCRPAR